MKVKEKQSILRTKEPVFIQCKTRDSAIAVLVESINDMKRVDAITARKIKLDATHCKTLPDVQRLYYNLLLKYEGNAVIK